MDVRELSAYEMRVLREAKSILRDWRKEHGTSTLGYFAAEEAECQIRSFLVMMATQDDE